MRAKSPSRGLAMLATLTMWAVAGGGAWLAAQGAATQIERRSAAAVAAALAPFGWVGPVTADGLKVVLNGTAPDEVARFRAVEAAGGVIDTRRIVDRIAVARPEAAPPPAFAVELLRNDAGISLIGLLPARTDRAAIVARLQRAAGEAPVTDLLQEADHPAPAGWEEALAFALAAAESAPRAKISITPGRVGVTAVTDSPADKARLEAALKRAKPDSVALLTAISTPRPVIAPFTLRFVIDAQGARFDACAADTEAARARILKAAAAAGAQGSPDCTLGLGVPTPAWADAAVAAIAALDGLGAGTVTLSDADIVLDAPLSVAPALFDQEVGRLQAALPEVFALTATLEKPAAPAPVPPDFVAERRAEGIVTLRGRITDARMRAAVDSLARARFGTVDSALRLDPQVPDGWTVRVIAGIEALAELATGSVTVTPDMVRVAGVSGQPRASDAAAAALARRLGPGARYALAIRYDRRLDEALNLPDGDTCVDRANAVLARAEIGFAPSRAEIEGDIGPTLQALAEALDECGAFRLEIGGHTDAQGAEDFNQTLSTDRARVVLAAMAAAGIDTRNIAAAGYGESVPVGDNETEAGRDANRRIEFRLLSPDPVPAPAPMPAPEVSGVTGGAAAKPVPEEAARSLPAATLPPGLAPATPRDPAPSAAAAPRPALDAGGRGSLFSPEAGAGTAFSQGDLRLQTLVPRGYGPDDDAPVADLPDAGYMDRDPTARPQPRPGL